MSRERVCVRERMSERQRMKIKKDKEGDKKLRTFYDKRTRRENRRVRQEK